MKCEGSSAPTSATGATSTQPEPTSDSPRTSVLMIGLRTNATGGIVRMAPIIVAHHPEAEEVAPGHGILL